MVVKTGFSTFDVIKIFDMKRERLREWMNHGFITPTMPAEGVGTKAAFTLLDVYQVGVFKKLVDAGVNRSIASLWVDVNDSFHNLQLANKVNYMILFERGSNKWKWMLLKEPGPWNMDHVVSQNDEWGLGIVVNFRKLRTQINGEIEKLQ